MALRYAAALARDRHARLTAVFAVDPLLSAAAAAAYDVRALSGNAREELQRFVRTTLGDRKASGVACRVTVGKPALVVVATAANLHADIIVIGTHGLSGIKKMFFGSTTDAILRRSKVPVLAIPRRCRKPGCTWPAGLMVASVDLNTHTRAEALAGVETAHAYGASLNIVHAVSDLHLPFWMRLNEHALNRSRVKLAQEWLRSEIGRTDGRPFQTHVIVGDTADAVTTFATARHADLLIVTLPAAPGLLNFRQGGAAYRLVCRSRCPVLLVHVPRRHVARSHPRSTLHGAVEHSARRTGIPIAKPEARRLHRAA